MLSSRTDNPSTNDVDSDYDSYNSVSCSDQTTVDYLLERLKTGERAFAYCGDDNTNYWRVFQCSGEVVVCVNCAHQECDVCPSAPNRLIAQPCKDTSTCQTGRSGYSVLSFGITRKILFPVLIYESEDVHEPRVFNILKSSADVNFNISKYGTVYSLAQRTEPNSVLEIKTLGTSFVASNTLNVTISLLNLLPEQEYTLYIYTEDFEGNGMLLSDVLNETFSFTTACCNSLRISAPTTSITQYYALSTDVPSVFSFSLANTMNSTCVMALTSSASSGTTFLPSSTFSFAPGTLSQKFQIVSTSTDTQTITVATSSCDKSVDSDSFSLSVRAYDVAAPAPVLKTIKFSDTGVAIVITFDRYAIRSKFSPSSPFFLNSFIFPIRHPALPIDSASQGRLIAVCCSTSMAILLPNVRSHLMFLLT